MGLPGRAGILGGQEGMNCNCQRWFWGVIPLGILCWLAVHVERGRIEQDLAERTGVALMARGYTWAVAAVEGRDIVLSGRAPDEEEPGKASEMLRGTWGVRLVDNRVDLLERAEHYVWAASRRGQRIRLTGYAPSLATRQVIIGVARANFPGFEIVDRTRLARGVPPLDTWLAGVSFGLRQLTYLRRGDVRLDGLNMTVTGEAEDLSEYRAVKAALTGLPKQIRLANNLVAPPSVSPHLWMARLEGDQITLSGHTPDETAGMHLLSLIRRAVPGLGIDNRMQPASGAPQGWSGAAAAGLKVLLSLKNGSAELKDATLTLSGLASDETNLQQLRAALRADLPEPFRLSDHLKSPTPLIVPPLPPAPPLPAELLAPPPAGPERPLAAFDISLPPPLPPAPPLPAELLAPPPAGPERPLAAFDISLPPPLPPPPLPAELTGEPPHAGSLSGGTPDSPAAPAASASNVAPSSTVPGSRHVVAAAPIATQSLPTPARAAAPPTEVPGPPLDIVLPVDLTAAARASACQDGLRIAAGTGPILFRVGSAELDDAGLAVLDSIAKSAKNCPELRIEIAGHASAEGGEERNQRLSIERARSVLAQLVKAGIEEARLQAVGYGAARPAAPNDSSANMARNRRIEFVVRRQ
jgi:outer membrane protein OmpA-like peptidoglycan-associated protein